jgi:hypothetical protein
MSTANDIISMALKLCAVKQPGETPTSDEVNDCLDILNFMLDKWNNEKLMLFYTLNSTKTLTSGTAEYVVGAGWDINTSIITDDAGTYTAGAITVSVNGDSYSQDYNTDKDTTLTALAAQLAAHRDVDTATYSSTTHTITLVANAGKSLYVTTTLTSITGTMTMAITNSTTSGTIVRPLKIESAFIRDSGSNDMPLSIINNSEYNSISNKTITGRPERLFYNPLSPYGYIYLWPVPDSAYTLSISQLNQLAQMTLTGTISLPSGYLYAIATNLALEIAPMFGKTVTEVMFKNAADAKSNIKATNMIPSVLNTSVDVLGGSAFNINRGW